MFKLKSNIKYLGYLFVAISAYYIAQSIIALNLNIHVLQSYLTNTHAFLFFTSLLLYILVLLLGSLLWIYLLKTLSHNTALPTKSLINVYAKSNLGKYLPGNVGHYIARNLLATKFSLSHKLIASASVMEVISVLFSGIMLMGIIYTLFSINIKLNKYTNYFYFLSEQNFYLLYIVLFVILFIVVFFKKYTYDYFHKFKFYFMRPSFLYAFNGYISTYMLQSIALILTMMIYSDITMSLHNYMNILFVFIFSWIIGYVVPGAPGGIGVREGIFIFLLSQLYPKDAVLLTSITYRLVNILGDLLFYYLTKQLNQRKHVHFNK